MEPPPPVYSNPLRRILDNPGCEVVTCRSMQEASRMLIRRIERGAEVVP